MKTLHLLRHAKSSWDEPGLPDRQRGLNRRGARDAPRMGRALGVRLAPLPIHSSPARRARLTLAGLCETWAGLGEMEHVIDEALYTFSADDLLTWLRERDDAMSVLFIIGHNPALTDLADVLTAGEGPANLPTAGYLRLALRIDRWHEIRQGCAVIESSLFPRQL